jgi:hypothetical protein
MMISSSIFTSTPFAMGVIWYAVDHNPANLVREPEGAEYCHDPVRFHGETVGSVKSPFTNKFTSGGHTSRAI